MKGLILSGGKGTRLRPFTLTYAKQLIPVANKPILFYGLEALVAAGIREIGIVVGETAPEIQQAVGNGRQFGAKVTYIPQDAPRGLAHAVLIAEKFLGKEPFVVYLGDNVIREGVTTFAEHFREKQPDAMILLAHVPNPSQYGVAKVLGHRVVRLVEKPKKPPSDLALVGVYLFTHQIFEQCRRLKPSWRGEYEITDAIQGLIDRKRRVEHRVVTGWWKDTGRAEDLLQANQLLLDHLPGKISGFVDKQSRIEGNVVVEPGARVVASVIRGPAVIGPGAVIDHSFIGRFTSVSGGAVIRNSEIEHSILLEGSHVENLEARLVDSLIGRNATVARDGGKPRAHQVLIGDSSTVRVV